MKKLKSTVCFFNTRPIGGLYVAFLTEFEKMILHIYLLTFQYGFFSGLILYFFSSKIFEY